MADTGSNAPVASKYIFLSQLSEQKPNTKVRFLCCIIYYDEAEGILTVEHNYPRTTLRQLCTSATIDVNIVLETIERDVLREGTWLNVIGYVQSTERERQTLNSAGGNRRKSELPHVQAVLVWNAGPLHVDQYEQVIARHLEAANKTSS